MRLSARAIINYNNVNSFDYADQWTIRAGEPNTLYFQIIDLDRMDCCSSCPSRYILGVGTSNQPYGVVVTFPSIDNNNLIQATAVQADPNDASIWAVSVSAVKSPSSGNVKFQVAQGTTLRNFSVLNLISVEYPNSDGSDGCLPDGPGVFSYNP